jgi:hypothetical protein
MKDNVFFDKKKEVTPDNITEAVQQAIEIEIATIPTYLYTYYSINRSPDQDAISGALVQELIKAGKTTQEANKIALDLSAEIMVFANKAGALIMSVAIEEMLHMALSSNLKTALGGMPDLVGKSPTVWPTCLPGHEPPFDINRAPLSQDQLMTFLLIESPDPIKLKGAKADPFPYRTIGLFYEQIENCIKNNDLTYSSFRPQLIPGKGYYAPNNIDTVYYDKKHSPRFVNSEDSGDLVQVVDRDSACKAINLIVEQGEGLKHAPGLKKGKVDCSIVPLDYDDASQKELSHFAKFSQIYCRYERLVHNFEKMGISHINPSRYFVNNVATNPMTADYPANIQPVSTLLNGVYTYIFVMTEGCYRSAGNTQYEIFMFGIHKSMIFILNSLCGDIMGLSYTAPDGKTYTAAPTFEDYPFGLLSSPKSQLIDLFNAAVAVYPTISYLAQRFQDLPDVALPTS